MKNLEISGRTVEEAIRKALERLGLKREEAKVTVLKEGKHGILGLGAEEAVVRVEEIDQAVPEMPRNQEMDGTITQAAIEVAEKLVSLLGLEASIVPEPDTIIGSESEPEKPVILDIRGEDLGILIGRRGQTLASLQYIVRLILARRTGQMVSVNLDVEGYKRRRYESLQSLALRLAAQVKERRIPFTLEPMPPDERRIIHLTLSSQPHITTKSVGEGEERKIMILPA